MTKTLKQHLSLLKQYLSLRWLLVRCEHERCEHEWVLHRTIGGNETIGNITLQHGSRLMKWCDNCGKTTSPTENEIKDNPPIFRTNQTTKSL